MAETPKPDENEMVLFLKRTRKVKYMQRSILAIVISFLSLANAALGWENRDIGAVTTAGSVQVAGDVYTIRGDGGDIWSYSDAFHYMYLPMSGDGVIIARVVSVQNTNSWAKAGVMIRESLNAGSAHAMMIVTPGNGVSFQYRSATDGESYSSATNSFTAPYWVKLSRSDNTITGFHSPDGQNWTQHASSTFSMAGDVFVGLCVTSHVAGTLCAAQFDSIDGTAISGTWRAINPTPQNGARQIDPAGTKLMWAPGPNPPGPIARYDVYFSDDSKLLGQPVSLLCSIPAGSPLECFVSPLAGGTTYYWRVDSVIDQSTIAVGWVWSFTTAVVPIEVCPIADINGDCQVTLDDLKLLSTQWLDVCSGNPDCADIVSPVGVDLRDFAALAADGNRKVGPVVINEIHYDPDVKTDLAEFVELYNVTDEPVNVSGWYFSNGFTFTFPDNSFIPPNGFVVIAQNAAKFQTKFGFAPAGQFEGKLSNEGETICLRDTNNDKVDEVTYKFGFPWPTVGDEPGKSIQLISPAMDNDLGGSWRGRTPTPNGLNECLAANAPPLMRQVNHSPRQPKANQGVEITVKVTDNDGVESATLSYQTVDPGSYIALQDPQYQTNWTQVTMFDDGTHGDRLMNDNIYTAVLPASLQIHRRLIRYKITALDKTGLSITGPYTDDPQPNFAYFVYNGVPTWRGANRPGVTPVIEYGTDVMRSLPVYHLITKKQNVADCMYWPGNVTDQYWGEDYPWAGTLVYNGEVYDHIHFRARGGVWRYSMGKNMWKFDFNRGHSFQAEDDYGQEYDTKWDKLNFSACIQQGDYQHRGEQGMFEALSFKLFNLAGEPASKTNWVHFRLIDESAEYGPTQYDGDFLGLYMTIEQMDGRFLDEHLLPDGNFYKMDGEYPDGCDKNNQGPTAVLDKSDVIAFRNAYQASPSAAWWMANVDLPSYYGYRAILEGVHHGDNGYGKNYFYYLNPETNVWTQMPWDVDLTWAENMYGNGNEPFKQYGLLNQSSLNLEYKNRLREIMDLLYNTDQCWQLIDDYAAIIDDPNQGGLSFVDADRAIWDYNPIMTSAYVNSSKAGAGRFYQKAATKDFPGMVQIMKDYVIYATNNTRNWQGSSGPSMNSLVADSAIPNTPVVTATCPNTFPINSLTFQTSAYGDPQGSGTFAAMKWRIAEVAVGSQGEPPSEDITLVSQGAQWRYFKGTREPNNPGEPRNVWRLEGFDVDGRGWFEAFTPIGYGETWITTGSQLNDMRYNYTTVYLRKEFDLTDLDAIDKLVVGVEYDDGYNLWLNGRRAAWGNVSAEELLCTATVSNRPQDDTTFNLTTLSDPAGYLEVGTNVIAVQLINSSLTQSGDCWIDVSLIGKPADPCSTPQPRPTRPGKYEIEPVWESPEITDFNNTIKIPPGDIRVGRTYRVRCRMKDNTGRWSYWSNAIQFVAGEPLAAGTLENLRITEVMYNPAPPPPPDNTDNDEFEFIELENIGDETLDLTYVSFVEGVTFDFNGSSITTLALGEFVLVVRNKTAFQSRYGSGLSGKIAGEYKDNVQNNLKNGGEVVKLVDFWNGTIAEFEYSDGRGWPLSADGAGHSLVPLNSALPGEPDGSLNYGGNWSAGTYIGGSPGRDDPLPPATVVINEVMAHTDYSNPQHPEYDSNDWIELYNPSTATINLSGFYLSDDIEELKKWAVPAIQLPANGRISFDEVTGFHKPITSGFGLDKAGEAVVLSYLPGTSQDRVVDFVRFKGQENNVSLGRYPDGGQYWFAMVPSRDSTNANPILDIVINEIMYHPVDANDEYIELYNPTTGAILLQNAEGAWRLDGAVNWTLPTGISIPAGGRLIIVGFDPWTETAHLNAFIAAYKTGPLTAGVNIIGPWSGDLSNAGERLALERPQAIDQPGDAIWVIVDEVIYSDFSPWPQSPDGDGDVLQRKYVDQYHSGNDPANWKAASPTPGRNP